MADDFQYDVFLSHNARDKPRVRRLAERLKQAGVRVWFDEWCVGPGDIIALKVDEGLEQSRVLLLCISPNALASGWVALERSTAIHRDPANTGRRFIPLLLADCKLPDTLRRYKYLDFREEAEAALDELLAVCLPEGEWPPSARQAGRDEQVKTHETEEIRESPTQREATPSENALRANSGAVSPDGKYWATGSDDRSVLLWTVVKGECFMVLEGHKSEITSLAFSADGKLLASLSAPDGTIRVWDVKSGTCLHVTESRVDQSSRKSIMFSRDGTRLYILSDSGELDNFEIVPHPISPEVSKYVNAKVVLVGDSGVGKSALAHRLVESKFVPTASTHGMNVWRLDLPGAGDELSEREALLWDLAGQQDYRLIHRLFLNDTALALVLFDAQKEEPFAGISDWVNQIQSVAHSDVPMILIASRIDVGSVLASRNQIDQFVSEHGFAGYLETSAKTGQNCSELRELVADLIPWDKLPSTSSPRHLRELKNAIVDLRDGDEQILSRFLELFQRLEQRLPRATFGEEEVRVAIALLSNHGLVLPLNFGELILLKPDALNIYAAAILHAARANADDIGCVRETDIVEGRLNLAGVDRIRIQDEQLLFRAILQMLFENSLCIAEETPQGRHLVFPSQYRREKDIPYEPAIFVSYSFSGEWQTVWTTLVVRLWYSNEFEHRELWRNAAEFAFSDRTLGLKIANQQGEGTGTISLYFDREVPDELKAIFIEYVHRHLAKYGCDVTRDRRYVCSECGKPVKDHDEVRKRLAAKKDFIYCQGCDEQVPLIDFIEQRLKSDPVARKILAMEETATRELDAQALEQILIGHMMAVCGEANQIFRPVTMFDYGIDGEVEFKDDNGQASGEKIYVQLKHGNSFLRTRKNDGREVFDVKNERHLNYWISQPVDVYLVIRQSDERSGDGTIRWMNVTRYLKTRKNKSSRQIIFDGEDLDMGAVWRLRDEFFPPSRGKAS